MKFEKQLDLDNIPRLAGQLLLASPSLNGSIFEHSVIYLTEHSKKEGAVGVILNHPTEQVAGQVLPPEEELTGLFHVPVHIGGPVETEHLIFGAFSQEQNARLDLRISAARAKKYLNSEKNVVHAYLGYSGWSPGQLEDELRRNSWILLKPSKNLAQLTHDKNLWFTLMSSISIFHRIMAEAPKEISLN